MSKLKYKVLHDVKIRRTIIVLSLIGIILDTKGIIKSIKLIKKLLKEELAYHNRLDEVDPSSPKDYEQ